VGEAILRKVWLEPPEIVGGYWKLHKMPQKAPDPVKIRSLEIVMIFFAKAR